ncbi:MAG: SCP2 sterol-binding domain-containing protein [Myxococcota bacterium]
MADTQEYFNNTLKEKLASNPQLVKDIGAVYVFKIDGAGEWTVDLTGDGEVKAEAIDGAGCVVEAAKADFENMLDNPGQAMMLFMSGKLKVSDVQLGLQLQKLLS